MTGALTNIANFISVHFIGLMILVFLFLSRKPKLRPKSTPSVWYAICSRCIQKKTCQECGGIGKVDIVPCYGSEQTIDCGYCCAGQISVDLYFIEKDQGKHHHLRVGSFPSKEEAVERCQSWNEEILGY